MKLPLNKYTIFLIVLSCFFSFTIPIFVKAVMGPSEDVINNAQNVNIDLENPLGVDNPVGSSVETVVTSVADAFSFMTEGVRPPILGVKIPFVSFSTPSAAEAKNPPWIGEYIRGVYNFSYLIAGILAVVMILVGGMLWSTSMGNSGQITKAKDIISGALIGLVIIISTSLILGVINPDIVTLKQTELATTEEVDFSAGSFAFVNTIFCPRDPKTEAEKRCKLGPDYCAKQQISQCADLLNVGKLLIDKVPGGAAHYNLNYNCSDMPGVSSCTSGVIKDSDGNPIYDASEPPQKSSPTSMDAESAASMQTCWQEYNNYQSDWTKRKYACFKKADDNYCSSGRDGGTRACSIMWSADMSLWGCDGSRQKPIVTTTQTCRAIDPADIDWLESCDSTDRKNYASNFYSFMKKCFPRERANARKQLDILAMKDKKKQADAIRAAENEYRTCFKRLYDLCDEQCETCPTYRNLKKDTDTKIFWPPKK